MSEPSGSPMPADAGSPEGGPLLDQGEIDALTGFRPRAVDPAPGLRGILDGAAAMREPLPLLGAVAADLARGLAVRLGGLVGRDMEAVANPVRPVRFGDVIDDLVLPAQVAVFTAEPWGGGGLLAIAPDLARIVLDGLLGAGRDLAGQSGPLRPFTPIERSILGRLAGLAREETERALAQVGPVRLRHDGLESDPRRIDLARPGDVAMVLEIRVTAQGAAGTISVVLPLATLEPVRDLLRRRSPGPRAGDDETWPRHLATEIWQSRLEARAVLHETRLPLRRILDLGIGDTLMFDRKPSDLVELRCGPLLVARGRVGQVDGRMALQVAEPLRAAPPDPEHQVPA